MQKRTFFHCMNWPHFSESYTNSSLDLHLVTGFCKTKSISCHKMNERCFFNAFKLTKLVGLQLGIATIFWAIVINQTKYITYWMPLGLTKKNSGKAEKKWENWRKNSSGKTCQKTLTFQSHKKSI